MASSPWRETGGTILEFAPPVNAPDPGCCESSRPGSSACCDEASPAWLERDRHCRTTEIVFVETGACPSVRQPLPSSAASVETSTPLHAANSIMPFGVGSSNAKTRLDAVCVFERQDVGTPGYVEAIRARVCQNVC
jgi:hypothetical protein